MASNRGAHRKWIEHVAAQTGSDVKSGNRSISLSELATHGPSSDEPWTAIRGSVYTIKEYLPFHPGGKDQLLRGAGKDATALYEAIHRWVNVDALLTGYRVGALSADDARATKSVPSVVLPPTLLSATDTDSWHETKLQTCLAFDRGFPVLRLRIPEGRCLGLGAPRDGDGLGPAVGTRLQVNVWLPDNNAAGAGAASAVAASTPVIFIGYAVSDPCTAGVQDVAVGWVLDTTNGRATRLGEAVQARQALTGLAADTPVWLRPCSSLSAAAHASAAIHALGEPSPATVTLSQDVLSRLPREARAIVTGYTGTGTASAGTQPSPPTGGLVLLRAPSGKWGAVPPGAVHAGLIGVWCIARGHGLLPFLPLLSWAASDACTLSVWLLWCHDLQSSTEPLDAVTLHLLDTMHRLADAASKRTGPAKLTIVTAGFPSDAPGPSPGVSSSSSSSVPHDAAFSGVDDMDDDHDDDGDDMDQHSGVADAVASSGAAGGTSHRSRLVHNVPAFVPTAQSTSSLAQAKLAPVPDGGLLTLVCGGGHGRGTGPTAMPAAGQAPADDWIAAMDTALRGCYYLASSCLEVPL